MRSMSRESWMRRINQRDRKTKLVKTKAHDPNWPRLGDYYVIDTKTGRVVLTHYDFASFAKDVAASRCFNAGQRRCRQ
jgi:hypothetical protein